MRDSLSRHRIIFMGMLVGILSGIVSPGLAATPPFRAEVAGRGPAMLFIPGLNSPGDVWKGVVDHYKDRYTCHVLTLAGFAGQPPLETPSLAAVRDGILRYIGEHRLERPVIVGHSLGAFLAFWVAATAPDKVGPLVAVDGVPFLPALMNPSATVESVRNQAENMRTAMVSAPAEARARQSALALATMISDAAHVTAAEKWAAASDPATTAQAMLELMTTDLRPSVSRITSPVLLVAAAGQFAAHPEALRSVEQLYERQIAQLPKHRTIVAKNARHFVMLDDLAFLTAAMDEFLAPAHAGLARRSDLLEWHRVATAGLPRRSGLLQRRRVAKAGLPRRSDLLQWRQVAKAGRS